jgi:hypothetical protein
MSAAKSLLAAIVFAASFAGVAYARDDIFTVKLATPVAERTQVIANNTIWICNDDTCLARPQHASSVRACRILARETGSRILAYGPEGDQLTAAELARCNGEGATQAAQN